MREKTNGLSPDLIIHPGETLSDILADRDISQKELAIRTSSTEKHISSIVNGKANITSDFAHKLERALGIDYKFWINLQANYDKEMIEFQETTKISDEEFSILRELKEITAYFVKQKYIDAKLSNEMLVLRLRELLQVNRLTVIPKLALVGAFRASKAHQINPFVLYAWQRLCELETEHIETIPDLDMEKLKSITEKIKPLMFSDANYMRACLTNIFAECGIAFCIVRHFKGAPVQGFIKKMENKTILCMTIRQSFADIFWFTLFHEIGHILNGDFEKQLIDFNLEDGEIEENADLFARNKLIQDEVFNEFAEKKDFSILSIKRFSEKNNIPAFIVIGRLQKEEYIDYKTHAQEKIRYKWEG